tara:strand:- start:27246 stop:28073 length:828 start_codon:yes stop_codon:yes gene_type:complete
MLYIISLILISAYLLLVFILGIETYFFGLDYIFDFILLILSFISDNPQYMPIFDFNIEELKELKIGCYINIVFFALFIINAFFFRFYNSNINEKRLKARKLFSWKLFIIAIVVLFAGINNYSELLRQEKLLNNYEEIQIENNGYSIIINNTLEVKIESGAYEDKKNKEITLEKKDYKISIFMLNIKDLNDYKKILNARYSYNLRLKKGKETKFKNKKAFAVEYLLNERYNRDYLIRSNKKFFVISLKTKESKNPKILKEFKEFLVSSIYINGENK